MYPEYSLNSASKWCLCLFVTECALQKRIKKNKISKVLYLVQKALLFYKKDAANKDTKKLLEVRMYFKITI